MLEITPTFSIDESELQFDFVRSSGPGGQNVNKVATAVQLRFDVSKSSLPEDVKRRLVQLAGQRVTTEGKMLIEAKRFRTQEQNRAEAIRRFVELLRKAWIPPKPRKQTGPTAAAKEKRIKTKKLKGEIKRMRKKHFDFE